MKIKLFNLDNDLIIFNPMIDNLSQDILEPFSEEFILLSLGYSLELNAISIILIPIRS